MSGIRWRRAAGALAPAPLLRFLERHRVQQALSCAMLTTRPVRFAVRELRGASEPAAYNLRGAGATFHIRHGTPDLGVVDEVFRRGWYSWPAPVAARLGSSHRPRVIDLGAHVGMFGVHVLRSFEGAEIVSYEPDPDNYATLVQTARANVGEDRWRTVRACAGVRDGQVSFAAGLSSGSHVAADPEAGSTVVKQVDVVPELAAADLAKIDVEGSEWELLGDPRFGESGPPVVVLEYHPEGCPERDPGGAARRLLTEHGYSVTEIDAAPSEGVGMLWAARSG